MGEPARKLEQVKKSKSSFDAMLKKSAKPKGPKQKAKSKVLEIKTPKDVREQVDRYIEAKALNKQSKADMDDSGERIIGFVRPYQDNDGYAGKFRHSFAVPGEKDGNKVKYVSSNRFSINAEDDEQLEDILGDAFDDLIERTFEVTLKKEVFEDDDLKDALMELVGDRFGEFFDTKVSLKVTEDFDRRIYDVVDKGNLPALRTFARPYKPSLR
jgi:hypothetical protein